MSAIAHEGQSLWVFLELQGTGSCKPPSVLGIFRSLKEQRVRLTMEPFLKPLGVVFFFQPAADGSNVTSIFEGLCD